MNHRRRIAAFAALLMLLGSVMVSPNLVTAQATPSATPQSTTGNGQTRSAPVAFGQAARSGDYTLRVVDVTPDARQAVMAAFPGNKPPATGHQFFMVRVEATYNGTASGMVATGLQFSAVGKSNVGYGILNSDCGSIPDGAITVGELFPGGKAQFNVCWSVATGDAISLVMYVDASFSPANRRWFSLDKATAKQ